jgi:hypothetical protein
LHFLKRMHPLVQQSSRHSSVPLFINTKNFIHYLVCPLPIFSWYKRNRDSFCLSKPFFQLLFHPLYSFFLILFIY